MSPLGGLGPGLYLSPDRSVADKYSTLVRGNDRNRAIVEGEIDPDARVRQLNADETEHLRGIYDGDPKQYVRRLREFSAGMRQQGYHVLQSATSPDIYAAIRPNVFLPTKVHYPDSRETIDLR